MMMGGASKPIKTPPFYAVIGHRWSQCSKGRNGVAVNSKFQALTPEGETIAGLYAVGDGCTIFGGLNLNINQGPSGNEGVLNRTEAYRKSQSESQSSPGGGMMAMGVPGGGGAPGGPGGGMPGMMGAMPETIDFSTDEGHPCGGMGPAFISGYYAAKYVSEFLKKA
jgi:hypothetical protein